MLITTKRKCWYFLDRDLSRFYIVTWNGSFYVALSKNSDSSIIDVKN